MDRRDRRTPGPNPRQTHDPAFRIGVPLMMLGVALTAFALFVIQTSSRQGEPVQPPAAALDGAEATPGLNADTFDGWLPPETALPADEPRAAPPSGTPAAPRPSGGSPPAGRPAIVRVSVPRIGVDAPVEVLGLTASGAMQDPRSPTAVAWYSFSARPGTQGNVVMAGHVDYRNHGPAVFYRLRELRPGDTVQVSLADGSVFTYEVTSSKYYHAATAPVSEIVGSTPYEAVTLITCGGTFDRASREYDQRLIVRATRVAPSATAAP